MKAVSYTHLDVYKRQLYYKEGKYAEAEPLYLRAIRIDGKALGVESPAVATDLDNMGLLLKREDKTADARDFFERALSIDEKALGPESSEVAICLTNLATLDEEEGKFADAEPLVQRADVYKRQLLQLRGPACAGRAR